MKSLTYSLPPDLAQAVTENLRAWEGSDRVARIWAGDATVWTGTDEAQWLGWLGIAAQQLAQRQRLEQFAAEVKAAGFKDALLLGMGGSSLCPEVMRLTFCGGAGFPDLHVLDSTDPGAGRGHRKEDRPEAHAVHRVEQVGLDAGTEYFQAIFFRTLRPRWKQIHRYYGPWLADAESCRAGWLPPHFFWSAVDRRALFGAIGFRHDSGGGDGRRRGQVPDTGGCDAAGLPGCRKTIQDLHSVCCWERWLVRGATN